jgi:CRP-like cAMP-binding protein
MSNPFIRKVEYGADLTDEDRALLMEVSADAKMLAGGTDVISEGDVPENVHLVMDGYACRYKVLPDGRRQIMAIFVPGDLCDLHVQILGEMDHSIGTLTKASMVEIDKDTIAELIANPRINRALWWASLVDEGTLREWLVSMGQRDSAEQMAHIFCELYMRLRAVGCGEEDGYQLPFTQDELSDLMGITPVHVNRTLTRLREDDLIRIEGKRLVIPDFDRLREFGGFDPNYLHLRGRKKESYGEMHESPPS